MISSIESICVCGAGTMGAGIAQVTAMAGFSTILYDVNHTKLQTAENAIDTNLRNQVDKGKIGNNIREACLSHLRYTSELNDCIADIFIEAIVEKPEAKIGLFNQLNEINHSEVIFATNTSSLSVSTIAERVMHPDRVVGLHFFNPAPVMKLVEVVKTPFTNTIVLDTALAFVNTLNKTAVLCKDAPGFIVNHVARPYYLEALKLSELGIGDYACIDRLLECSGFKMGPFRLMDLIGNDINFAVSVSLYEALGRPERLRPSPIQQRKIETGELGRKAGRGYYEYNKEIENLKG